MNTGITSGAILRISSLALLCVLTPGRASLAAIYYVAKTGLNSNTCTQAQSVTMAKLTVAGGLACMSSGDTLIIKGGTYGEYITQNQIPAGIGNTARTTIQAAPGETVTLQPLTGTPNRGTGHAVWIYGKHNVTLNGLIIDGTNVSGTGIFINNNSSFIRLENLEVKNARGNCIAAQIGFNVEILNSKIHDCGVGTLEHGIYLRGSNHLIEHNEIYNIAGHGVHQWHRQKPNDNNIIRQNYVHDNGSRGILIGSGNNNVAEKNIVANNGTRSLQGGITVGYFSPDNNKVSDNIIYSNSGGCIIILGGSANSQVQNNICWQNGSDGVRDGGSMSLINNTRVVNPLTEGKPG